MEKNNSESLGVALVAAPLILFIVLLTAFDAHGANTVTEFLFVCVLAAVSVILGIYGPAYIISKIYH